MIGINTLLTATVAMVAVVDTPAPASARDIAAPMAQSPGPATPAPDPARLAAATTAVAALVPEGVYERMMRDQFPVMMDAMMAEMMGMDASSFGGEADGGSMREMAAKADPVFEERTRIMARVMGEELGGVMSGLEPRVRAGLARAFARKFTVTQLADMNVFFATPSGKVFANEYLAMFADPEMVREMAAAAPEMMRAMPAIMAKVEAATAHLPQPPKPGAPDADDAPMSQDPESPQE